MKRGRTSIKSQGTAGEKKGGLEVPGGGEDKEEVGSFWGAGEARSPGGVKKPVRSIMRKINGQTAGGGEKKKAPNA